MSRWSYAYALDTTATPAQIWSRWTDASTWAKDDPGVIWAAFDGTPRTGSTGRVKSHGAPPQKFTFSAVDHQRLMDFIIQLPLADLTFGHSMEPSAAGLTVTHQIRLDGPLARIYGVLIGRSLAAALPDVVRTVISAALPT